MGLLDKIPFTLGTNGGTEYDPHSWDNLDKLSVRERLTPSDPRRVAIAGAVITLVVGLALYLSRLFPTAPLVFATGAIALQFMMYYFVECVSATKGRIIGYIDAEVFDAKCRSIEPGQTYKLDEDGYNWTSRDANYFVESEQLWLAYRDD